MKRWLRQNDKTVRALLTLFFFAFLAATAHAATYYVGTAGSDSNSCATAQSAAAGDRKLTIAGGIACLATGDTLIIGDGNYTSGILLDTILQGASWNSRTLIRAENNRKAVISGTAGGLSAIAVRGDNRIGGTAPRYVEFDGLFLQGASVGGGGIYIGKGATHIRFKNGTVRDFLATNMSTVAAFSDATTATGGEPGYPIFVEILDSIFDNNVFHGNVAGGDFSQCFYMSGGSITITGNTITNCHATAIRIEHADDPSSPTLIANNTLAGHESHCIQVATNGATIRNNICHSSATAEWAGIRVFGNDVKTINNTIYGNSNGGILIGVAWQPAHNNVIKNNISRNNGGSGDLQLWGTGHVVDKNFFEDAIDDQGSGNTTTNTSTADPLFVNAGAGNFNLSASSPAIDSCADVGLPYNGVAPDCGAIELAVGIGHSFTLNWSNPATNETGTRIYRNGAMIVEVVGADLVSFVDTVQGVAGQQFCYEVSNINASGESPKSNTACAMIPMPVVPVPLSPQGLQVK